jgi:hypothetical protein
MKDLLNSPDTSLWQCKSMAALGCSTASTGWAWLLATDISSYHSSLQGLMVGWLLIREQQQVLDLASMPTMDTTAQH